MPLAIVAILLVLSGGASVAARSALPGDPLYPIKNVSESVRATLTFSERGKAAYEAHRAEVRLEEAEKLSVDESVSASVRADIEANFKAFSDRTQMRIDALADVDARAAADIASRFETALRTHEKVLARLTAKDKESNDELKKLQADVDSELSDTVKVRVRAESDVKAEGSGPDVQEAAQGKITAATNVITEVRRFIDVKKDQLGAEAVARANAELSAAEGLNARAAAKLEAKAYADAFMLANSALRTAQGAKQLIEVQEDLDVDLDLDGEREAVSTQSPRPSPRTEGLNESEDNMGDGNRARVNIELGF